MLQDSRCKLKYIMQGQVQAHIMKAFNATDAKSRTYEPLKIEIVFTNLIKNSNAL